MHAAARKIMEVHGGVFPRQLDHILALPGIGRYTAGAIYSFAYNLPAPIVEANTQRLYARLLLIRQPLTERASQVKLWEFAEKIITPTQSRSINHAAMELGALLCQPKPQCERCPLTELCPTYAHRLQNQIPVAKPKIAYVDRHEAAVVIQNECGEYRLRKCGPDEWWSGSGIFLAWRSQGAFSRLPTWKGSRHKSKLALASLVASSLPCSNCAIRSRDIESPFIV